jgi:hypothetical protein
VAFSPRIAMDRRSSRVILAKRFLSSFTVVANGDEKLLRK